MNEDPQSPTEHWWNRLPPIFFVIVALSMIAAQTVVDSGREALLSLAGVFIGAAIVLEAVRRHNE